MADLSKILNAAFEHHQAGRLQDAEAGYRRALKADPRHVGALRLYGALLCHGGRPKEAIDCFARALMRQAQNADLWFDMARAQLLCGDDRLGIAGLTRALALQPSHPTALRQMATTLDALGRVLESWRAWARLLRLHPADDGVRLAERDIGERARLTELFHHAVGLMDDNRFADALPLFQAVLQASPANNTVMGNVAACALQLGDEAAALRQSARALRLDPRHLDVLQIYGDALYATERDEEAAAVFAEAIAIAPAASSAHYNRAFALLRQGRSAEGWDEYEWRWGSRALRAQARAFDCPQWDGRSLEGKDILVHFEQGMGDGFHFARYVPAVIAAAPRRLYLEAPPAAAAALRDSFDPACVILTPRAADFPGSSGLPRTDFHIPLMSLPRLFGDQPKGVPAGGYLRADPAKTQAWRDRLAGHAGTKPLRCGLVWAGNPLFPGDTHRSAPLAALAPLAELAGVALFSLQVGPAAAKLAEFPGRIIDLSPLLTDFGETAAALEALDLVISVDTAVAHLGGALGRPTWLLLPKPAEWRWGVHPTRTPWYDTVRLFRQRRRGDWRDPIEEAALALQDASDLARRRQA